MEEYPDDNIPEEEPLLDDRTTFSISCTNLPESLLHATTARDHFEKFGPVARIILRPKKSECIVDYEYHTSAQKAILNAGAYDGFMFNVRWNKPKRISKANEDPDWVPDKELAEELTAMKNDQYIPRLKRQQKMELDKATTAFFKKPLKKAAAQRELKNKPISVEKSEPKSDNVQLVAQAKKPLEKGDITELLTKSWTACDEKLKALDLRDRIIRSRLLVRKGAIKGCCPDMCPERERLLRQCQKQIASYELDPKTGQFNNCYAVKQYSRSSADQEEPLPHELRPVPVLKRTLVYLLDNIMDNCDNPEVDLGDWFHFLWDRLRAIRKDITQQALCCEESVNIIEACARFHAHCAARLVEEPPSSFDQRLNTENLLKCLQTLKYMYEDLRTKNDAAACVNEPEFRAYVILLNLNDSNFMWEVQQLDPIVQSSPEVRFAIKVFTALDNKNYRKFFKLVQETTYLNACILFRYFNDIRLHALVRMMKSYSPRGVSQFPAEDLAYILAFESVESMTFYLNHYGIQVTNIKDVPYVLLDKSSFYDNETPYTLERATNLVESKKTHRLGEIIFGGKLPEMKEHIPHNSFAPNNSLKRSALLAEDQGYVPAQATIDEINAIINSRSIKTPTVTEKAAPVQPTKNFVFGAPIAAPISQGSQSLFGQNQIPSNPFGVQKPPSTQENNMLFKFSPPAKVQQPTWPKPTDVFGKAAENTASNLFGKVSENASTKFKPFGKVDEKDNPFGKSEDKNTENITPKINPMDVWKNASSVFNREPSEVFGKSATNIFGASSAKPPAFNTVSTQPSAVFGNFNNQTSKLSFQSTQNEVPFGGNDYLKTLEEEKARKLKEEQAEKERLEMEARAIAQKVKEEKERQEREAQAAAARKREEEKRLQELEKKRKEEELARKLEQEKAERLAIERQKELERKKLEFEMKVDRESNELVPELINEVVNEICKSQIIEDIRWINKIKQTTLDTFDELMEEISRETSKREIIIALRLKEIGLRFLTRKYTYKWRNTVKKMRKRKDLLFLTPSWLSKYDSIEAPLSQVDALKRMKNFHHGTLPSLRILSPKAKRKILLFDLVKKPLLQKSREIRSTSDIFWKVTFSSPSGIECRNLHLFFKKWFQTTFINEKALPNTDYLVYLKEHFWHKKICISFSSIFDSCGPKFSIDGSNGFIYYSTGDTQNFTHTKQRIESTLNSNKVSNPIPIVIVLLSSNNRVWYEHQLNIKKIGNVSEYIFLTPESCDDDGIVSVTKKALHWLARRNTKYPSIECNLISAFLDQTIGSELWYRFNVSKNSSIRPAFEDVSTIIDLYNEAIEKTIEMITHADLMKCSSFPEEFKQYLYYDNVYPKEFSFVENDWKVTNEKIAQQLEELKLPKYKGKTSTNNIEEFQTSINQFLKEIFHEFDDILDKILAMIKSLDDIPWLNIINVVAVERISKYVTNLPSKSRPIVAVYKKEHLQNYRTAPWWYRTPVIRKMEHVVEDLPDDDPDVSMHKRRRLDSSDEVMPEDSWISNVLTNLNESIDGANRCRKMFKSLDDSLSKEVEKQNRLEKLLKSALEDE